MPAHRAILRGLALLCAALIATMAPAGETRVVTSVGVAVMGPADTQDTARRRAMADALASAALGAGAELSGYSAMDKGRITADLTILRAMGRVLSWRILSSRQLGARWEVRIEARVGPVPPGECAGRRRLIVTAEVPAITVAPDAPAWSTATAEALARDLVQTLKAHPDAVLDRVVAAAPRDTGLPATLDYTQLTRGRPRAQAGDHVFAPTIDIAVVPAVGGVGVRLRAGLSLGGPEGVTRRRIVTNDVTIPATALARSLTGRHRTRAEAALTQGVEAALTTMLDSMACMAPTARAQFSGGVLRVPLGRRHGLTRDSLALIEGDGTAFGMLEIQSLSRDAAVLRPLDPSRPAAGFHGAQLYFLRAGLRG